MRIATFNIYWLGTSRSAIVRRAPSDEALVARVIAGIGADVLALQEICCRATLDRVLEAASALTGRRYTATSEGEWVSSARPGEAADRGIQKVVYAWDTNVTHLHAWERLGGPALRPPVVARFEGFTLGAVHLKSGIHGAPMEDPSAQQRHIEAQALAEWGATREEPCLILGDMNARTGDPSIAPLESMAGWHWPVPVVDEDWTAYHDRAIIDRIGSNRPIRTRGWAWDRDPSLGHDFHAVAEFRAQRVRDVPPGPVEELYRVSDHRPVFVDL